jgi:transposase-like protein
MVDHIVDASERRGGVDIRVGVGRRRRWRAEDKGRIVAESYAPGAVVSEVARRHDIMPQHLFAWRKAARAGRLTLPGRGSSDVCAGGDDDPRGGRGGGGYERAWVDRDRDCGGLGFARKEVLISAG